MLLHPYKLVSIIPELYKLSNVNTADAHLITCSKHALFVLICELLGLSQPSIDTFLVVCTIRISLLTVRTPCTKKAFDAE